MSITSLEVQRRVRAALAYFATGFGFTTFVAYALRNSTKLLALAPEYVVFGYLPIAFATILAITSLDYETQFLKKHLFWLAFHANIGLVLVPLIHRASFNIIFDAFLITAACVAGLGLVAWNSPSETFLQWGGSVGMGLAGLTMFSA